MTVTTTLPPELAAYLEAVRSALGDLPASERDELLADVEASLFEAAADTGEPLRVRFGEPEQFARELRSAAGLGMPAAPAPARTAWRDVLRGLAQRSRPVARELAPCWWAARGLLLAAVLVLWLDSGDYDFGGPLVLALTVGTVASLAVGLAARRHGGGLRTLSVALSAAALAALLPVVSQLDEERAAAVQVIAAEPIATPFVPGLSYGGVPVRNVFPYSRDGRLLLDVLLYDENGQPLGGPPPGPEDPDRRVLVDRSGAPVLNAYPIRYFEPRTQRVANPEAAPAVIRPQIVTPKLKKRR